MPQVGESKTINGVTGTWDGQTWRRAAAPADTSQVSAVDPGETSSPWLARIKGFLQGGATGLPTAAKIVQTAAPFVTGGASIPIQAAVGGGTQMVSDMADSMAGDPNAPHNFTEFLTRAAEGAAIPSAMSGIYRGVKALKPLISEGGTGGVTGGAMGAYEGYKRNGMLGALEGGALGAVGGSALGNRLGKVFQRANPAEEQTAESLVDRYMPNKSPSREVPGSSYSGAEESVPPTFAPRDTSRFASGPRIESGMGSRTPEQAALFERGVAGPNAQQENLNASINTTDVRPRSATAPVSTPPAAPRAMEQSPALQGLTPSPRGTEMPLWSTEGETELPNGLQKELLDLDQNYRRHTYDQRAPYLTGK